MDDQATCEETTFMSSQPLKWSLNLRGLAPQVAVAGGTIREANESSFPALAGNGLAIYLLELQPGAVRIPHWHPDAAELDYCLEGTAAVTLAAPTGEWNRVELGPGFISIIPQGWFHTIANTGDGPARLLVIFNNSAPTDIGISEGLRGVSDEVLGLVFGVAPARFAGIDRNVGYIAPQGPPQP
jgi:oxalate decarboxylase